VSIAGVGVLCLPKDCAQVAGTLEQLEGVEIHHIRLSEGKIAISIEAPDTQAQIARLREVQKLPEVLLAEVAYHAFEDEEHPEAPLQEVLDKLRAH